MRFTTSRRFFLTLLLLSSCGVRRSVGREQFTIGTLSYGVGSAQKTIAQYDTIKQYLEEKLQSLVQIEPAFNEIKALERLKAQAWSLVFATPGLAAIAISQYQYTALRPLEGINNIRSILVVRNDSPISNIQALTGKKLAIGQPGSATGYYFPLYNLYGMTLAELVVSPTPQVILENVAQGLADVGALSLQEFNTYKKLIPQTEFRVLFEDSHKVPTGAILVSPTVEVKLQDFIQQTLQNTPSSISQEAGFIPQGTVPDYKYMISVVNRVRSIFPADQSQTAALLTQKPVRLFKDSK